ncbi:MULTISPECIES: MFS transporter [unclassified Cryobacterium]|uniref:MFS transporter n=1 Tax=unclassified Cryobacterium TaxID=2649013 RepID=UPI002AB35ECE|nr:MULTISPECIES: MFS transporter [Cryobacterium]MDY7526408.1 MFS transporter [Cryobacterium sp. 10C2]MDY7557786.1 MFS transporter [Cryobacterium sp. 10C3]MEB0003273.1 MFS transporter [Cryobacterium sp. RTC2.1]MEB0202839.1 MFS transporter [Cryobacterium sp. 5I3]MEB0287769.1 MFS transporter [Cryobacterium sp. 10S3]
MTIQENAEIVSAAEPTPAVFGSEARLNTKEKVAYGFGDLGSGFMFDLGQAYLTKFWIDTAGIGPAVVALIFVLVKLFDAVMDPLAAIFIDSRKIGKRGKFRPVMMVSAILLAVMTVVTFTMVSFVLCYRGTKENVVINRAASSGKNGIKDYARAVLTNRPLLGLVLMSLFTISSMNVNNMMMIFFAQYNLGNLALQAVLNLVMIGASIVGIMFIPRLVMRFGKKRTVMGSFIIAIVANGLDFIIPTNLWTFMILVTIGSAALAIPNGITWAFVSDTIDYGEWHTGVRKEGVTSAAFSFSRKLAQSRAAVVGAGMLAVTGYVAKATSQSGETLEGIKAVMTLYPALALVIAAIIIYFIYTVSDDKYRRIANDLDERRWEHGIIGESTSSTSAK